MGAKAAVANSRHGFPVTSLHLEDPIHSNMTRALSLAISFMLALLFIAPAAQAQVPADLMKSFTKLTSKTDKFIGKVDPWMGQVKKNEALIPGNVRPQYDSFSKSYSDYTGKFNLAKGDPGKLTSELIGGLSGDLGKMSTQFSGLQKQFKGLPFMK